MNPTIGLFVIFFVSLMLGVPVIFSPALSSIFYLLVTDMGLAIMANQFFSGMDSFVLLCIPGFLLAGGLMNGGGITDRIVSFSNARLGHIRGGFGYGQRKWLNDFCRNFRHSGIGSRKYRFGYDPSHETQWVRRTVFGGNYGCSLDGWTDHPSQRTNDYRRHVNGVVRG